MDTTLENEIVQRTLTSFICDHEAGRNPDPTLYARRCPSEESRAELERSIAEYLDLNDLLGSTTANGDRGGVADGLESQIGAYRVEAELGRGGMAQVFEVWDHDLNRSLAMKVSRQARLNSDGTVPPGHEGEVARFLQEAQITSQLRHPGIVPVHQLGVDERGHVFFTMQLIEQETLRDVLEHMREGRPDAWTRTRVLDVLSKACDAVAFAHSQGVIHRDLKPANLMVGKYGEVYVLDWGLAKLIGEDAPSIGLFLQSQDMGSTFVADPWLPEVDESSASITRDGAVLGTPAYMPPEQALDDAEDIGKPSDVYALGAILYEVLTGAPPYHGALSQEERSFENVLALAQAGPPAPVETLAQDAPAELCAICTKAMQRDPARRYASVIELREDLQAFLDGRVVQAHATGALAELRTWVRRNRATAASALALFVVVVAALGGWLYLRNQQFHEQQLRSDRGELLRLTRESDELWPVHPDRIPALETWIEEARGLASRQDEHRAWQSRNGVPSDGTDHVSRLSGFLASGSVFGRMEARLGAARTIAARSVEGTEARRLWAEAREAIAADPRYDFELEPILGLLPLGADPRSGLWEFVDLQTGAAPARNADGELVPTVDTGIVFVLIPAGQDWIGAQSNDPAGHNYVPEAAGGSFEVEAPRSVSVVPYLLSKYEMTQGQWERVTGKNPSQYQPGSQHEGHVTTLLHPVEMVGWEDCRAVLSRLDMRLPSEDEWEYAARAGTDTPWFTGLDKSSLFGSANLADRTAAKVGMPTGDTKDQPDYDDGFAWHAPVGSFLPNAFGLHDVHGNIFEWCSDSWTLVRSARIVGPENHAIRGGSWTNRAAFHRSAYRIGAPHSAERSSLGVRPARSLPR